MKKEYPSLDELRTKFAANKEIPQKYEEPILKALSHFPELEKVKIVFKTKDKHPVPYGTVPVAGLRVSYEISILESADPPMEGALLKNLPETAQVGVIGHELSHVVQFEKGGMGPVVKAIVGYSSNNAQREMERGADVLAIEHGLGFELYTHACFIRAIPGYVEQRKEIDINYLHPNEILEALPPDQLQEIR
jgi:hypothetical protein